MFYWTDSIAGRAILISCVILFFSACDPDKQGVGFYPVDSLVEAQVATLTEFEATLMKEASLRHETDTALFTPDSAAWEEELAAFRQLEVINKPVNAGSYVVRENELDPGSNLNVKSFTSTSEERPVRYLRIYYDRSVSKPRKIEALYIENNALYSSKKRLSMEFESINDRTVLTSYAVQGSQKIMFDDSVAFSVKGKIQLN